jgi:hypothetical protein
MTTIITRSFTFSQVDKCLDKLKTYKICFGPTPTADTCTWCIRNVAGAAKFLAWICEQNRIYWDDSAYTDSERAAWRSESLFAHYLHVAGCFASQPTKTSGTTGTGSTGSAGAGSTRATSTGSAPKRGYKSAGPQSAYVAGLVGKPGDKAPISDRYIYCIVGDKAGTITPKAFIHPVENPAIGERAKVNSAGLPIVKFGAGNGYTDLAIFSKTPDTMERILDSLRRDGKSLTKYSGVHVIRVKTDSSNYFRVNTEFGEVFVKSTKLNEKLFEEATAAEDAPLAESSTPAIIDMDKFVRDSKMYD